MSRKPPLLFLAHRIPYPPNKGDKIRSFHLLKHLCGSYAVYLGGFVDDPNDSQYSEKLEGMCAEVHLENINPRLRKLRSLSGLLRGLPLTLPYYDSGAMRQWVGRTLQRHSPQAVVVFSSSMAQFVMGAEVDSGTKRLIDFVDVDSAKWSEYARRHGGPLGIVYRREGKRLLEFERAVASTFDASIFVSEQEADVFKELAPESVDRIHAMPNGVDTNYFDPALEHVDPYASECPNLVFTGAMDYWANVDAVSWFTHEVFPTVRGRYPSARFHIVGARPTQAVKNLQNAPGVCVTGAVPDVRPYLAHADLAVAPLRVARGLQNKVLEALAMAKPVVATTAAMDGISPTSEIMVEPADDPQGMMEQVCRWLSSDERETAGRLGRRFVINRFSWAQHLERMDELLGSAPRNHRVTPAEGVIGRERGDALEARQ